MSFSIIINYILYGLSGFCFGVFASRYCVLAMRHIKTKYQTEGLSVLFACFPQILFIFTCFFLFPSWFLTRTTTGGFVYYIILLFFFNKGIRNK